MAKGKGESESKAKLPAGVSVTKCTPPGKKADFFIARHEPSRQQFTGETAEEAVEKLNEFLAEQE
jgi:hypothetical protein